MSPADKKPASPAQPEAEPPDLWKSFQRWVWKHFGWVGLAVILDFVVGWSQWERISKVPGIEALVARINEQATLTAIPGKFNVAIAHLEGDEDHAKERVIRDSLRDRFPITNTMSFDRLISSEDEREVHERARALLKASGFDVMIWGALNQPRYNEMDFAQETGDAFHLYRVFQFRVEPKLYILQGDLSKQSHLEPIGYRASFRKIAS